VGGLGVPSPSGRGGRPGAAGRDCGGEAEPGPVHQEDECDVRAPGTELKNIDQLFTLTITITISFAIQFSQFIWDMFRYFLNLQEPVRVEEQKRGLIELLTTVSNIMFLTWRFLLQHQFQVKRCKEEFNEKVLSLQSRKRSLFSELSSITDQLAFIQHDRLASEKRRQVPQVPTMVAIEEKWDPFEIDEGEVLRIKTDLARKESNREGMNETD
jgi:hypothetical protein